MGITVTVEWVPSGLNPADAISRAADGRDARAAVVQNGTNRKDLVVATVVANGIVCIAILGLCFKVHGVFFVGIFLQGSLNCSPNLL